MCCNNCNLLFTTRGATVCVPEGETVWVTSKHCGDICTEGFNSVLVEASAPRSNDSDITVCLHVDNNRGCDRKIEAFTLSPGETARCFQRVCGNDLSITATAEECHRHHECDHCNDRDNRSHRPRRENLLSVAVFGTNRC